MDKMKLYNAMPIFVQNIGCRREGGRLAELRFGGDFKSRLADYNSRIACSRDELLDIRDRKLRKMVQFCYDEVAFYADRVDKGGVNPAKIKNADDLAAFAILDKHTVRNNV